ncbi:MAG: hypothetical protein ACI828_001735 [Flavobacteriales bacterium]|jgi:hypothetical protein
MKKIILIAALGMIAFASAQEDRDAVAANNNGLVALASQGVGFSGGHGVIYNPPRGVVGSVYLFDNWKNSAIIETVENKRYKVNTVNFNAKANTIEARINGDSIFTFDYTNIDRVLINNRTFKNSYSPVEGGYRIFEVIAETKDFSIYKDYTLDIKEGNPNPMLAQANDKYVLKDKYYMKKGKSFKKMKLKKSSVLKLAGKKAGELEAFAKKNRLSFKNERDLQKIATYYNTL